MQATHLNGCLITYWPSAITILEVNNFRYVSPINFLNLKDAYTLNEPFPHIVIENFLDPGLALRGSKEFPPKSDPNWIQYSHYNEDKCAITELAKMPEFFNELILELNSQSFVKTLEDLTGIRQLKMDPSLHGGGLHMTKKGGFLNIHADFTAHPINRRWKRRVNLLLYFNDNWNDSYAGHLELWSRDMKSCVHRLSPTLNRCVIFNTDDDSYHGVPAPLNCPTETTRNSLALYYYTESASKAKLKPTNYRARPGESDRRMFIWLDKTLVAFYTRTKATLGISDQKIGIVLRKIRKNKE